MTIIYCLIAIVTVFLYLMKKYHAFLLCYIALLTNLFMLDVIGSSIRGSDLCFFLNIILLPIAFSRRKKEAIHDIKTNRIVKLFIAFILFEFAITIFTGADTVTFSLKVIRIPLLFLAYYPFSTIPLEIYKSFLKTMLWITIIQGILYILQFVGINLLAGGFEENNDSLSLGLNIPSFIYFYIIFCLDAEYTSKYKYLLLAFFISIILLTFVRSMIISVIFGTIIYIIMVRGIKRSMTTILAMLIIAPIVTNVLDKKTESRGTKMSTFDEVKLLFSGTDNIKNMAGDGGTSMFRIAMLLERFDYLKEKPEYMLFGVGAIHEDSPNCYNRFNFSLGTKNEGRYLGKCLIESGDITWVPIILRYGLIGITIHIFLLYTIAKLALKRKDLLRILFPLIVLYFIISFYGPIFEHPKRCIELVLYLSLLSRCFTEEKELKL